MCTKRNIHRILVAKQDAGTSLSKLINKYFATIQFATIAKIMVRASD